MESELNHICEILKEHGFRCVALQFPDSLLSLAPEIQSKLESKAVEAEFYILADSSRDVGSCCNDEVAAEHVKADFIVHFGYSCLSSPSRIPVYYCLYPSANFGNDVSDDQVISAVQEIIKENNSVGLRFKFHPLFYHHYKRLLGEHFPTISMESIELLRFPVNKQNEDNENSSNKKVIGDDDDDNVVVVYVGEECILESNLYMRQSVISLRQHLGSKTAMISSSQSKNQRLIMKRFYAVERTKAAQIIGIVVATTTVARYQDVIKKVQMLCKDKGRKTYTLALGKINPAKLANFPEIDVFCLISCPETAELLGNCDPETMKNYIRPIVSPLELEHALNQRKRQWTGKLSSAFEDFLCEIENENENDAQTSNEDSDDEPPDFNLATGTLHRLCLKDSSRGTFATESSSSLNREIATIKNGSKALVQFSSPSAVYLNSKRTYQGLDPRLGLEGKETKVLMGRSGIPASYD